MNYNDYSLQSLREYGKHIGVKAPTSMKKADLIKAIEDIIVGEVEPVYREMGRKNKDRIFFEYRHDHKEENDCKKNDCENCMYKRIIKYLERIIKEDCK